MHNRTLAKHLRQASRLGLLAAFLLTGCLSPSPTTTGTPPAGEGECPRMICKDTLGLYLVGLRSDDFTLTATAPDGARVRVRCVDYSGRSWAWPGRPRAECGLTAGLRPQYILFYNFLPEVFTVTLAWDGHEISEEFVPEYSLYQPAGPDCPPTCRTGSAVLNVLEYP